MPNSDRAAAGLILTESDAPRCDDFRVGGPVVRWDDSSNLWRMWYYCRSRNFPDDLAPAFGTGSIATAVSRDGIAWKRVEGCLGQGAVMEPASAADAFDSTHIGTGDVIRRGNRWLMVYFGGNGEIPPDTIAPYAYPGYRIRLGLAESADGMSWSRIEGAGTQGAIIDIPPGSVYAAFPGLVASAEGFLVHFTTIDNLGQYHRTRCARSDDLRLWTHLKEFRFESDPLPHESAGIVTRDIVENPTDLPGRWLMLYTAHDGRPETSGRRSICAAVSDDLQRWKRVSGRPVFTVGPRGSWDSGGVAVPRLVVAGDELRLYYYGWSISPDGEPRTRGVGCASSSRGDLGRFRRISAGPDSPA